MHALLSAARVRWSDRATPVRRPALLLLTLSIALCALPLSARAEPAEPGGSTETTSREEPEAAVAGSEDEPLDEESDDVDSLDHAPQLEESTTTTHAPVPQATDYDEVVITAAPHSRRRFDVIQGTSVLSQEELERALQPNLGETLAEQPGISSTYFGPGASRPVIRGLDGPRIRVLQNGLGTLDASVTSPDHQVSSDPLAASRIEIVRGAGTLAYGTSAIGGVVNIDDGRIPTELPTDVVEGDVRALYGSAAEEKSAGAGLTTATGPIAYRAAGYFRASNDLSIPGFTTSDQLRQVRPDVPTGPYGIAPNTSTDAQGGTLGTSWIGDDAMLGVAYGSNDSDYGVPSEPDEAVMIDLNQQRVDVNGQLEREFLIFEQASFKYAWGTYQHKEIEGGEIATIFDNQGNEARFDLVQQPWRDLHGSMGAQILNRDLSVSGDESFLPPSNTLNWGLFAIQEYDLDRFNFEAGLRYERQTVNADSVAFSRAFDSISFSLGAGWEFVDDWLLGLNLSRTERPPAAEELLSYGPHLATAGYEIGDPNLDNEAGFTVEGTLRKRRGRYTFGANVYWTHFDDYIALLSQGFVDESGQSDPTGDLVLRLYTPVEAEFVGGEVTGAVDVIQTERFTGAVDVGFDWVRATVQNSTSDRLPRIPPFRIKSGIEGRSELADLRFELWWVAEQDRIAAFELPTDSYLMLNLSLTLHPFPDNRNLTVIVQGRNLTNQQARVHASFLKDDLPLPGAEARVGIKVAF